MERLKERIDLMVTDIRKDGSDGSSCGKRQEKQKKKIG